MLVYFYYDPRSEEGPINLLISFRVIYNTDEKIMYHVGYGVKYFYGREERYYDK